MGRGGYVPLYWALSVVGAEAAVGSLAQPEVGMVAAPLRSGGVGYRHRDRDQRPNHQYGYCFCLDHLAMPKAVLFAFLLCFAAASLPAQLLQEAVRAFPVQTTSLEYDALSKLRLLSNYASLRKQYSGEGLDRAQETCCCWAFRKTNSSEVVTASGPNGFFGLLAGDIRHSRGDHGGRQARHRAKSLCRRSGVSRSRRRYWLSAAPREDKRAFFGTIEQIRVISDARQGRTPSLQSNATLMDLMGRTDPRSPVIGFAPGRDMGAWIGTSIPQSISSRLDVTRLFSTIQIFAYGVKMDSKAHVELSLICTSEQSSTVLRDALSAASGLERAAAMAAGSSVLPFDNMVVRSSGKLVAVNLDAPLP